MIQHIFEVSNVSHISFRANYESRVVPLHDRQNIIVGTLSDLEPFKDNKSYKYNYKLITTDATIDPMYMGES
jgi:hypothetical protein